MTVAPTVSFKLISF